MAIPALSAARALCELRNWQVSNLELQKILYLAQMFYLGRTNGEPLIAEHFEAWDYGPVVPDLYRHVKGFGDQPVRNVFHWVEEVDHARPEFSLLQEAANGTANIKPGRLIAITHWDKGAWAQVYKPGEHHIRIPNRLILEEYRAREKAAA